MFHLIKMNQKFFNRFYNQYLKIILHLQWSMWKYWKSYKHKIDDWKHLSEDWKSVKDEIVYESGLYGGSFRFYASIFKWIWWSILTKMSWNKENIYKDNRTMLENCISNYSFFDHFYGIKYLYHNNKQDFNYFIENFWLVFIYYKYLLDTMKELLQTTYSNQIVSLRTYNQFLLDYERSQKDFKIIEESLWKEYVEFSIKLFDRIDLLNLKKIFKKFNVFYHYFYEFFRDDELVRKNDYIFSKDELYKLHNKQLYDYTIEDLREIHSYLENNKNEYIVQNTFFLESLLDWMWKRDNLKEYIYKIFNHSIFLKSDIKLKNFEEAKNLILWIVKNMFEYVNTSYNNVLLNTKKWSLKYNILTEYLRNTYSRLYNFFRYFWIDNDDIAWEYVEYNENFEVSEEDITKVFFKDDMINTNYELEIEQKKLFDIIYFKRFLYKKYNYFQETINSELYFIWLFDVIIQNKNSEFSQRLLDFFFSYFDLSRYFIYREVILYNVFIQYYEKHKDRYDATRFEKIKFYFLEHLKNFRTLHKQIDIIFQNYKK